MTYKEAIGYINSFTKSGAPVIDLSRFRALAAALGNPQDKLRFVHVAGTNGKGSLCEYISCGLISAGLKTGKFTSPYISRLEERFQLDNAQISPEQLARCCGQVARAAAKTGRTDYSQFEILTAMAFLYYLEEKTDVVVLETGIGGTLDCTNIITPLLSVITTVDIDHWQILGDTVEAVAAHKAGIIKRDVPVVASPCQQAAAVKVIAARASELNARLIMAADSDFDVQTTSLEGTEFSYKGRSFCTAMGGVHQAVNAVCAIDALTELEKILDRKVDFAAAMKARLPARMELVQGKGGLWLIDGGHNVNGAVAAKALLEKEKRTKTVIIGMMANKDYQGVFQQLLPLAKMIIAVDFFAAGTVPSGEIAKAAEKTGVPCKTAATAREAVALALRSGAELNCVMGSLYLAGTVRSLILSK